MSVNNALSVSDIVVVELNISPTAAAQRNFGSLLIMGDSGVINTQDRYRLYASAAGVAADFGANAPEALAADIYFDQTPQPAQVYVGAWARTATHGSLLGEVLGATQEILSNFTGIVNGAMGISVDGTPHALATLNFSAQTNLNGVAAVVQTALSGAATCIWDSVNNQFVVKSSTTGTASIVSPATAPGSGTDVSGLLGLTAADGAESVNGIAAETFAAACAVMTSLTSAWYGIMCAAAAPPSDNDYIAAAAVIQGSTVSRIMGITTQESATLQQSSTTDLASLLKQRRAFVMYSSSSPYACAAIFGDAFTVDFDGSDTMITLKFKQAGGVVAETLSETQAAVLKAKNCNVFVEYNNDTAIIQEGVMSDGTFFDIVHGADWLVNDIQTNAFNTMLQSPKIPQTDQGVDILLCTVSNALDQSVTNGYVAPGVWTGPPFGSIKTGQTLPKGYYVFAPAIATQSTADRGARKAPKITAGIKLAGAIHSADIGLNVNQ
jgi:hypothetical protein